MVDVVLGLLELVCTMRQRWSERRRIIVGAAILAFVILFIVIAVTESSG